MTAPGRTTRVERFETVVIGGGQAGLAVGHSLAQQDADFVILDGAPRVGESWRQRWDSLRLFTPARHSGLPGMPFPAPPSHLPDKDEVADYLTRYAERFDLPVRLDTRVASLEHDGGRFLLATKDCAFEADQVVVATGPFQQPKIPSVARRLSPDIQQLHSSEYRNAFTLPDSRRTDRRRAVSRESTREGGCGEPEAQRAGRWHAHCMARRPLPDELLRSPFRVSEAFALDVSARRLRPPVIAAPFHGARSPEPGGDARLRKRLPFLPGRLHL